MSEKKFRGYCYEFGGFVYGRLFKSNATGILYIEGIDEDYGDYLPDVDPESIAQLVGRDKNGNEIYEGDMLTDNFGQEYVAQLQDDSMFIFTLSLKENNEQLLLKKILGN